MTDCERQHCASLAVGERLRWLTLFRPIVAVHVVVVEMIIDESDCLPSLLEQDLEHDGVSLDGTSAHAHEHARIWSAERYLELLPATQEPDQPRPWSRSKRE